MSDGFAYPNFGDHIHPIAQQEDLTPTPITNFDYDFDQLTSESTVAMSDVCSAFCVVLDWIAAPRELNMCSARVHAMRTMLDPIHSRYKSLNEIASDHNVTRSALSKSLLTLRDAHGIRLTVGRLASSRRIYAEAQRESVLNGRHAGQKNDNLQLHSGDHEMDKEKLNTLSKALDAVAELEHELAAAKQSKPQLPPYVSVPQSVPKSPVPSLQEVDLETLKESLDLARRAGRSDLVKRFYSEYARRKGR